MVPHVRSDHPTKYFGYWSKNSRVMDKSLKWPFFGVRQNHHPGLNASTLPEGSKLGMFETGDKEIIKDFSFLNYIVFLRYVFKTTFSSSGELPL